jgi:hypothetical protein
MVALPNSLLTITLSEPLTLSKDAGQYRLFVAAPHRRDQYAGKSIDYKKVIKLSSKIQRSFRWPYFEKIAQAVLGTRSRARIVRVDGSQRENPY